MSYPYLVRRNNHYYCRIWIPEDLKSHFNCCEIKRSLKTSNCNNARTLVKALVYRAERIFMLIRSGMLTNDQIKTIAANFIKSTLNRTEELRSIAVVTYEDGAAKAEPVRIGNAEQVAGVVAQSVSACESLIQRYKDQLFVNDFSAIEARLGWHLEQNMVSVDKSSKDYVKLCRAILKAEIEVKKIEIERLKGNYDNSHDMYYQNIVSLTPVPDTLSYTPVTPSSPEYMLTNMINEYTNEAKLSGCWTEKTCYEYTSLYDHFIRVIGDRDIRNITHKDMLEFRDTISKLPANMNKVKACQGKSIAEIVSMKFDNTVSITTINKYIQRIGALFSWAVRHQYIPHNCVDGLSIKVKKVADQERSVYDKDDIEKILAQLPRDEKRPERFWIPVIGLYSGMRLDEICQLHIEDIKKIDGVPCFDVNDDGEKKLKNPSSKRIVPIHPVLSKLGLLQFIQQLKNSGQDRLWPNLKKRRDGYAQDFGRWYQVFNRENITDDPKKVFHSFRHTITNNLKQRGIEESIIAEIVGHATGSITMSRYGKRYEPKKLMDALKKLDYGIEIDKISPKKSSVSGNTGVIVK
jgi:integrase